MDWKPYNACCAASAENPEAAFCGECGTQLLRCAAYSECGSLVEPLKPCTACLGVELFVDQGAVTTAKVGQQLSVPLILKNATRASRPIWVKDAVVQRNGEEPRSIAMPWERIDANEERRINVSTGALAAGGTGTLEVSLTLGTSYKGYEERYVFGSTIQVSVDEQSGDKIEQHINFAGAQFGTGGLVNIKDVAAGGKSANSETSNRISLPFERHERLEVERGIRGYQHSGVRVPRIAPFQFLGFPKGHAPKAAITVGPRNTLTFGRNSRQFDKEQNPTPSDIVLRIVDPTTGNMEVDGSTSFSRHHFDLVIQNERVCAHVRGSNGILVNDQHIPTTKFHILQDGDTIKPVATRPELLSLRLQFVTQPDGSLAQVQVIRIPDQSASSPADSNLIAKTIVYSRNEQASSTLETGSEFDGRYLIERVIGAGGMGTVYLAKDIGNADNVALKLIHPSMLSDDAAADQLIAEGRVTRKIRHPNVVTINRVAKADKQPYIEMEYLDGKSLRVWISEQLNAGIEITVETAKGIVDAILEGLNAAHSEGVIHRDLKPENVILLGDPSKGDFRLKLLDFGIAKATNVSLITSSSSAAGTPLYMAPEQRTSPDAAGPSADIYSLSRIFYELLMDVLPDGAWQGPSEHRNDVPAGVDPLLQKGLSNRPRSRHQSVEEFRRDLKQAFIPKTKGPNNIIDDSPPGGEVSSPVLEGWDAAKIGKALAVGFAGLLFLGLLFEGDEGGDGEQASAMSFRASTQEPTGVFWWQVEGSVNGNRFSGDISGGGDVGTVTGTLTDETHLNGLIVWPNGGAFQRTLHIGHAPGQ